MFFHIINGVEVFNCTPNHLSIITDEGIVNIPSSGIRVKVREIFTQISDTLELPVSERSFGEGFNLPEEQEGRIHIISSLCLEALKSSGLKRGDLYAPGPMVRNAIGNVIGVKGLVK